MGTSSWMEELNLARQQTCRLHWRKSKNGTPGTTAHSFLQSSRMKGGPDIMQAEELRYPIWLQAGIASNDVRGFAEHCLAFAPVPSPTA